MNKTLSICILFVVFFSSCIRGVSTSDEHHIIIDFSANNELSVNDFLIIKGNIRDIDNNYSALHFEPLRGGFESILGYAYKNKHGDDYENRVKITCNSFEHNFSVNEILAWPTKKVRDENIYIAPAICTN